MEQLDLREVVGRGLRDAVVERLELAPPLDAREDLLEPRERDLVAGVHREHALEVRHRALGIAELLVVQRRGAHTEDEGDAHGDRLVFGG